MNVLNVGFIIGVIALFLPGINRSAVSIYREIDDDIQIHYRYTVAGKEYEQTRGIRMANIILVEANHGIPTPPYCSAPTQSVQTSLCITNPMIPPKPT